jgi:hypothetical protein
MTSLLRLSALSAAAGILLASAGAARAHFLFTGNDEKVSFDENTGKTITHQAGKDTVSIIDIADPAKPKIIVNLPLMNTITGPPVNPAITPDRHLALVANSLEWVKDGDGWKGTPDNKIYVIDLTASPPTQLGTVEAGKQPSGMAINKAGTLALVANRADDSVSVLSIEGKNVKPVGTVSVATQPTPAVATPPPALPVAVAITPDGKRALVVKSGANRVGLLDIDGQKVSYAQVDGKNYDMATGLNPLNVPESDDHDDGDLHPQASRRDTREHPTLWVNWMTRPVRPFGKNGSRPAKSYEPFPFANMALNSTFASPLIPSVK